MHACGTPTIRSARDAGLEPSGLDVIIGKDGSTTFRVYGGGTVPAQTGAREWEAAPAAIEKSTKRAAKKATRTKHR